MTYMALALMGPLQATLDGQPAGGLQSDWLRALLAYLAVESRREHPREALAALLWPERPDQEALSALRYALSNLRGALGDRRPTRDGQVPDPFLLVTRSSLQFNPASDHWLDVEEFQDLSGRSDVSSLERAVSLYRGPFLYSLSVTDSPAFDEWVLFKSETYRRAVLSALGHLTSLQMARGAHQEAERWARRQLEFEPYREQAHRQLMAALALSGERSAALAHYKACRRMLREGLGCEPEDETQALHAQIRNGALPRPRPPLLVTGSPSPPVPIGAQPLSPFVAREQELARLGVLLDGALAGQGGAALVAGEAGAGKSALLDEFAWQAVEAHGDLIALRGQCNAHGGAGDLYLPFREMLQTLAGDVEGKRAGGVLSVEQVRRAWEALPAVGAALVEHGPDLIDMFVPGEAFLRRVEGFATSRSPGAWQVRLGEIVRRAREEAETGAGPGLSAPEPQASLFTQVTQVLHTVSRHNPLLLVIDDLQWADRGTAALLFHLMRRLAGRRILLACACRPEALGRRSGAGRQEGDVGVVLRELCREWGDVLVDLDKADGRAFVEAYVDSEPNHLGEAFRQALYGHTAGNPLFTVELLHNFEDAGALVQDDAGWWVEGPGLDWECWPPKIEALIAGALAALTDEDLFLLQAASVQGEQFLAEVAARVLDRDEEVAVRRLSGPLRTRQRLVEAVNLDRLPLSGQRLSRYRFRHALLQRSAYRSLDEVQRTWLHESTGRALEAIFAAESEHFLAQTPQLARHFEAAGMPLEAAGYHLEAGRWAARLAAYDEATAHLERGLALLEGVSPSVERLRLELRLCTAMGTPAMLQRGWQAPAYTQTLERLSELTHHPDLHDDAERFAALSVLALSASWSADPVRSGRVGQQLLDLVPSEDPSTSLWTNSRQAQDRNQQALVLGHWALGLSHWLRGQPVCAREHLSRALILYDPEASRPLAGSLVGDPGVMAWAMLGAVQWQLGYPDQGRASLEQAVAHAETLEQPSSVGFAHFIAAMATSVVGREVAAALRHADALRPLGQVSLVYRAWAEMLAEQAQAQCGQTDAGAVEPGSEQSLAQAVEAGSNWQAPGSGGGYAGLMLLLADLCAQAGQVEMGLSAVDQAQAWIERTDMRAADAEAWRMRGELLLIDRPNRSVQVEEAEACFQRALGIAREQQARIYELRTALSIARLRQGQGRHDEARELLAGIYSWFTEGFDTVDLVEAKALLEELA